MKRTLAIAFVSLIISGCDNDEAAQRAKNARFMADCHAAGRQTYDCQLQWDTYAEAHAGHLAAEAASASAAGAQVFSSVAVSTAAAPR